MSKLYELTEDYSMLEEMFDDEEVDEQTLLDTLEGIEGEYNDVMEYKCKMIKNYEALAKAKKEEADRLSNQARTINNRIKWLKDKMLISLVATGKEEAGGDVLKCKIAKAGGKNPIILAEDIDVDSLPDEYKRIETSVNKENVRKALEDGIKLDFAELGERGKYLRIR